MKTTFFVFAFLLTLSAYAQDAFTLKVNITGATSEKGQLLVSLFNHSEDYLKKAFEIKKIDLSKDNEHSIAFEGLSSGEYAIAVVLDENMNNTLDFGDRGPVEKYGFSNNPPSLHGPATYSQSKIKLDQNKAITIQVE